MPVKYDEHGLTEFQAAFVNQYMIDKNATQAYRRAGSKCKTEQALAVNASRMLRIDKVSQEIERLKGNIEEETMITTKYVVESLKDIADRNIEINDKVAVKALELLGKHTGAYEADNKQKRDESLIILANLAARR